MGEGLEFPFIVRDVWVEVEQQIVCFIRKRGLNQYKVFHAWTLNGQREAQQTYAKYKATVYDSLLWLVG